MEENKTMDNQATELTTEVEITDLTPAEEQTAETGDSMIKGAIVGAAVVGIGIGVYKGVKFIRKKVKERSARKKAEKAEADYLEDDDVEWVDNINPSDETENTEG